MEWFSQSIILEPPFHFCTEEWKGLDRPARPHQGRNTTGPKQIRNLKLTPSPKMVSAPPLIQDQHWKCIYEKVRFIHWKNSCIVGFFLEPFFSNDFKNTFFHIDLVYSRFYSRSTLRKDQTSLIKKWTPSFTISTNPCGWATAL